MARYRDQAGRPIVVVTGMGVVTSLGIGAADNWRRRTAGESGIHAITRFATEGLKTRIAGTIDFVQVERPSSPELSERLAEMVAEEAIAEAGIGARGGCPGPLVFGGPADRARMAAAADHRRRLRRQRHHHQPGSGAGRRYRA